MKFKMLLGKVLEGGRRRGGGDNQLPFALSTTLGTHMK